MHSGLICITVCLSGFAEPTLCTTIMVQSYLVNHQAALFTSDLRVCKSQWELLAGGLTSRSSCFIYYQCGNAICLVFMQWMDIFLSIQVWAFVVLCTHTYSWFTNYMQWFVRKYLSMRYLQQTIADEYWLYLCLLYFCFFFADPFVHIFAFPAYEQSLKEFLNTIFC